MQCDSARLKSAIFARKTTKNLLRIRLNLAWESVGDVAYYVHIMNRLVFEQRLPTVRFVLFKS